MFELAFTVSGDSFEVPALVTGWRVRRMKPRGAPELVYGRDGRPLMVPIDADVDDLREAVSGVLGRYRLDPVNDDGKLVDAVPAAYIHVVKGENTAELVTSPAHEDSRSDVLREAMRMNTELAKSVIDRFPEMMHSAAELLRAADGAGLPARHPCSADIADAPNPSLDDDDASTPVFDLNAILAQLVPMLMAGLASGTMKMPGLASLFDWRKASPAAEAHPQGGATAPHQTARIAAPTQDVAAAPPPIDPAAMAHVFAVQSALKPEEVAFVQEVAKDLSADELRSWVTKLGKLSVSEAVVEVRSLIAGERGTGGAK